ncbi:MAG TPA: NADPH-dependent F420 reductase [Alphaproteobacteria bacterium]|nr:NADPH-dependent F420 reductase [Alphaproteobacteria bacterium]
MSDTLPTLAVLGGTGAEGSGLAFRWAHAGYPVILGSRSAEKAETGAAELNALLGKDLVRGMDNLSAAKEADIAILTVPWSAQKSTISDVAPALQGKILVDVTVPLVPPKVNRVQLPEGGSAVLAMQQMLGDGVKVVSAFQNVSAHHLKDLHHDVECDVLVCGDDIPAREAVIKLADACGLRGIHAGPLQNSVVAEALTSVLISINQRYKIPGAGIRITGLPE